MTRRRHAPEQVIRKLREAEWLIGEGKTIAEAAKDLSATGARGAYGAHARVLVSDQHAS